MLEPAPVIKEGGMSALPSEVGVDQRVCLHPSVGLSVDPARMTATQKVAAVARVRCLEHDLFAGDRICRTMKRDEAEQLVAKVNELRRALGWLEINPDGKWRWPQVAA
jgi:hypothetical protein